MSVATSWKTEPLGQVVDFIGGGTPSRAEPSFWGGTIPWATVKDFKSTSLARTGESITEEGLRSSASRIIKRGTLIMPTRMALGKVAVAEIDVAINQDLKALSPRRPINSRFLLHALLARAPQIEARGNGATVKGITIDDLGALSLHYPDDEAEQRRIAAILDKADAIRARRRAALADVNALARATFVHLFGDPLTNSNHLPVCPVAEYGRVVTGNTPPRVDKVNYGPGIEWIKSDNINTPSHFLTPAVEHLSEAGERLSRAVPPGSILVTCIAGSPDCIGNAAIADRRVAFNQQINAIVPHIDSDTAFVYAHLFVSKKLVQLSSTNSMKGMVSKSQFELIPFLKPSEHDRREFSEKFRKIVAVHKRCTNALADADALYASLAARAFRGEL